MPSKRSKRFHVITMGCQMNEYDSDLVSQALLRSGYVPAEDAGEADLVEEVCRIYGLDNIAPAAMERPSAIARPVLNPLQKRMLAARRTLATRGFNEAITWAFLPEEHAKLFGGGQPELKLANPISSELSDMRPSLLPNLIAAAGRNVGVQHQPRAGLPRLDRVDEPPAVLVADVQPRHRPDLAVVRGIVGKGPHLGILVQDADQPGGAVRRGQVVGLEHRPADGVRVRPACRRLLRVIGQERKELHLVPTDVGRREVDERDLAGHAAPLPVELAHGADLRRRASLRRANLSGRHRCGY